MFWLLLIFGIIPLAAGVASLGVSVTCAVKSRNALQGAVAVGMAALLYVASRCLASIFFRDAWPTYFPHLLIGGCMLVAFVQWRWRRRAVS